MERMDYEEFKKLISGNILKYLPEEYQDAAVEMKTMVKNNDIKMDALIIQKKGQKAFPIIYLNGYYEDYRAGWPAAAVLENIAKIRTEQDAKEEFLRSIDLAGAKEKVVCRLVNYERNKEWLMDKPYQRMEDLAVVYVVYLDRKENETLSVVVTDQLLGRLGIPEEELYPLALSNMERLLPCRFERMQDVLLGLMAQDMMLQFDIDEEAAKELAAQAMPPDLGLQVYCLSNCDNTYGAAEILLPEVLERIAEQAGGDYYIIPSSVHEVLIIPKTADSDYRELEEMVKEVNASEVQPKEQLSGYVYEYDAEQKLLCLSCRREDAREEREPEKDGQDSRRSLKRQGR